MFAMLVPGEERLVRPSRQALNFFSPPGGGKSFLLSAPQFARFNRISSGDWCRREMGEGETPETELGRQIRPYVKSGQLVPFPLYLQLVVRYVPAGFTGQLVALDALERAMSHRPLIASRLVGYTVHNVFVDTPLDVCRERMLAVRCRAGETSNVIEERFRAYKEFTLPLVEYYRSEKKLIVLDGQALPEENAALLFETLGLSPLALQESPYQRMLRA